MIKHVIYIVILLQPLISSDSLSINARLAEYGIIFDDEKHLEKSRTLIKKGIQDKIRTILNPDNFIVNVEVIRIKSIFHDSNFVDVTMDKEDNILINYKKDVNDVFTSNPLLTMMRVFDEQNLVLHLSFKPKITVYIDNLISVNNSKANIEDFIINVLNNHEGNRADFSTCEDCIFFKSVDISEFKTKNEKKKYSIRREDVYKNSWAVIIGIDKYKNVPNLDYAVKDAEKIKSLLIDNYNFPEEKVTILVDKEATLSNIKSLLSNVSKSAGENDRVLIFFAGHGQTMDLPDGGEMGYLMPVDGIQNDLFATSIPMDDFKKVAAMSRAKHMLFLVDACYGGLAAVGQRGLASTTPNYIDKITKGKSRQIITAGGRGEQVIEKSEWGHSAFTLNLIRALEDGNADLNDDGYITAEELGLFLKEKVTIDSENQQTPQSRRFTSQEGEFIFINQVDELIIQNNETVSVEPSSEIDYDILADKIAGRLNKKEVKTPKIRILLNKIYDTNVHTFIEISFNRHGTAKIGADFTNKKFSIKPYLLAAGFGELGVIAQYNGEKGFIGIGTSTISRDTWSLENADDFGNTSRKGIPFRIGIGSSELFNISYEADLMSNEEFSPTMNDEAPTDTTIKSRIESGRFSFTVNILDKIFVNSGVFWREIKSYNSYEFLVFDDGSVGIGNPDQEVFNSEGIALNVSRSDTRLESYGTFYLSAYYQIKLKKFTIKPGILNSYNNNTRFEEYFNPTQFLDEGLLEDSFGFSPGWETSLYLSFGYNL